MDNHSETNIIVHFDRYFLDIDRQLEMLKMLGSNPSGANRLFLLYPARSRICLSKCKMILKIECMSTESVQLDLLSLDHHPDTKIIVHFDM